MKENEIKITNNKNSKIKKLTLINVIASMFTTIFLVDSIVPAAATGSSTIIWYLIIGITFYIPYGFITAEFASKIPDEGGVYVWVKKTLGIGFAKRVSWYYWVNVGIWVPSIALYIAQLMAYLWFPNLDGNSYAWTTTLIAIVFMWASLAFSYFPISENQKLYSYSTIGKILIVLFLFIGMITYIVEGKSSETDFSLIPSEFQKTGAFIMFLPALVYNILGLEAIAGEASKIKNPRKTMARATIITTLSLLVFYIATTVALQYIFDSSTGLDLTGIMIGLSNAFGDTEIGSKIVINILGIVFIFTMFVETMGWVSGANAGINESAINKEVPKIFKWKNKRGMPFKSTIILGIIGTLELILFTLIGQIIGGEAGENVFWSLFAASSNILFLSYFIMFVAYGKSKLKGTLEKYEGFTNNKIFGLVITLCGTIVLAITWFLLLWNPEYDFVSQSLPIILSVIIALGAGELTFLYANKKFRGSWKEEVVNE